MRFSSISFMLILALFFLSCDDDDLTSAAEEPGRIVGRLTDAVTDTPVSNALIQTRPPTSSVRSDSSGVFIIPDAPPTEYTVAATKHGYTPASVDIRVVSAKTTRADMALMAADSTDSPRGDLVAHLPFNGNANDASGHGNHGTVHGAQLTADRFGQANKAYQFDGNDYLQFNSPIVTQPPYAVSLWFYSTPAPRSRYIIANGGETEASEGMFLLAVGTDELNGAYYDFPTTGILFGVGDSARNFRSGLFYPTEDYKWYHIVGEWDGTAARTGLKIYIDGKPVHDHAQTQVWNARLIFGPRNNLRIGAPSIPNTQPFHFHGALDDVRLYNRLLTESEIQRLSNDRPQRQDEDLVAHLPFNGNAHDESGYGNHGTVHGAQLTADRFGRPNSAYLFDGIDDYIDLGNANSLNPKDAITLVAWYKPTRSWSGTGNDVLISKGFYSHDLPAYQYHLGIVGDQFTRIPRSFQFYVTTAAQNLNWLEGGGNLWQKDQWHCVAGTYDGAKIRIYVDGRLIEQKDAAGSMSDYGKSVQIAKFNNLTNCTPGAIDDIRIYNRALSASEIQRLSNDRPQQSQGGNLVAHLLFNGNAHDESGYGNHGTVHGAQLTTNRFGEANKAYQFDGQEAYIEVADAPALHTTREVTVSVWVNWHLPQATHNRILTKIRTQAAGGASYHLVIKDNHLIWGITASRETTTNMENVTAPREFPKNRWAHIVGRYDGASLTLYIDGEVVTNRVVQKTIYYDEGPLAIGRYDRKFGEYFDGDVDDIRIYNRALSASEIQQLSNDRPQQQGGDLLLHLPFNGNAKDESGYNNHGTVYGAQLTADRFGQANNAYQFDGVDDYIDFGTQIPASSYKTVSFWLRTTDGTNNYGAFDLNTPANDGGIGFAIGATLDGVPENTLYTAFRDAKWYTGYYPRIFAKTNVNDNIWHHITFLYDGNAHLFVDGQVEQEMIRNATLVDTNRRLYVGHLVNHPVGQYHFKGEIDDIRIYNRALSVSEIQRLSNDRPQQQGGDLVLHLPFNGSAKDESGNGYHGSVHGASLTFDRFNRPNRAYYFDGENDYISLGENTLNFGANQSFSVAVWIKAESLPGVQWFHYIIAKGGSNWVKGYCLLVEGKVTPENLMGRAVFTITLDGHQTDWAVGGPVIVDNQWHHLTGIRDVSTSEFKLYLDGVLVNSNPVAPAFMGDLTNPYDLRIGNMSWMPDGQFFHGAIDEVRIYKHALSESEILEIGKN